MSILKELNYKELNYFCDEKSMHFEKIVEINSKRSMDFPCFFCCHALASRYEQEFLITAILFHGLVYSVGKV